MWTATARMGGNRRARARRATAGGGRRGDCRRRFRGPRPDSFRGEGEEDAASLSAAFDLRGEGRNDDDELGTVAAMAELGRREGARREGAVGGKG